MLKFDLLNPRGQGFVALQALVNFYLDENCEKHKKFFKKKYIYIDF